MRQWSLRMVRVNAALLVVIALFAPLRCRAADAASTADEERTASYFRSISDNSGQLLLFLRGMPKGGDLHNHLVGGIYAESFIQWAAQDGLCVDPKTFFISLGPCVSDKGTLPASKALSDVVLYRQMVDAYSMRNWQISGESGHDHFFDSFDKFIVASFGHTGDMLTETAALAARQRELYQELMHAAAFPEVIALANRSGWDDDFARQRDKLLANGLAQVVAAARKEMDEGEAVRNAALRCDTPQAEPGCTVVQRYQYMVLRAMPKEIVFAQMVLGFELAAIDPRFVAVNLVQPEDWYVPLRDFPLQMRMMDYLHTVYPKVHIALHAGELSQGLVTPEALSFHIRASVETGHAERIGHGADLLYEDHPEELLRELAQRDVLIEVCPSSYLTILGLKGAWHPLHEYLRADVPIALATDDEGVSRSDMTNEFLLAVLDQHLSYAQLKKMVRNSLQYAFLPGASLWRDAGSFTPVKECTADFQRGEPSAACRDFLSRSSKADLQWTLEKQFRQFESQPWPAGEASAAAQSN